MRIDIYLIFHFSVQEKPMLLYTCKSLSISQVLPLCRVFVCIHMGILGFLALLLLLPTFLLLLAGSESILFWPWAEFLLIPIILIGSFGFSRHTNHSSCK